MGLMVGEYRRKRAVMCLVVGRFMSCRKMKGVIALSSCQAARIITHDKFVMGREWNMSWGGCDRYY